MHTIFDYIVKSLKNDERCGKVLAGWKMRHGDTYFGGYPPRLEDITVESGKVENFVNLILAHQVKIEGEHICLFAVRFSTNVENILFNKCFQNTCFH